MERQEGAEAYASHPGSSARPHHRRRRLVQCRVRWPLRHGPLKVTGQLVTIIGVRVGTRGGGGGWLRCSVPSGYIGLIRFRIGTCHFQRWKLSKESLRWLSAVSRSGSIRGGSSIPVVEVWLVKRWIRMIRLTMSQMIVVRVRTLSVVHPRVRGEVQAVVLVHLRVHIFSIQLISRYTGVV